ncbi:ABC transporter ATP-binding protein/permease [Erysipelotrichaceae bacterium RD49]|nr:ABC transporter ATP-binding protein/permease [Erysipelotrichaceae bacterium RD49]
MFNKRLIQSVPEAMKFIRANVIDQWCGLVCSIATTLILSWICACFLQNSPLTWSQLALAVVGLVGLSAIRTFFTRKANAKAVASSHCVKKTMRERLLAKVAAIGPSYVRSFSSAEVTQLSNDGIEQLESYFANYLPQFFYALIAPITLFLFLAFWDLRSALILLVCVPLIPMSIVMVQKFAKKLLNKYWGQYAGLSDSFLEKLQGLTTLKVYNADERKHVKMNEEAENFRKVTMRVLIMQLNSISVMDLVAYGGAAAGIISALFSFRSGNIDLFQALSILLLSAEFFLPMRLLGSYFHVSLNGSAAADRMFKILDVPVPEKTASFPEGKPIFKADDLCFAYEDGQGKKALDHLDFEFSGPAFIGICGESGSGKSTLASLLAGKNYDSSKALKIGQTPIQAIKSEELSDQITVLSFESALFSGTIRENLLMADPEASDEQMIKALKQAGLWQDLEKLNGLDTVVSEQAASLSGGQRQRAAFARALLKNAPVLILDEATSAVDSQAERLMMKAAHQAAQDRLVICISHRLANLDGADTILVLKDGQLVEKGTAAKLKAQNGEYTRMYERQVQLEAYSALLDQDDSKQDGADQKHETTKNTGQSKGGTR